MIYIYKKDNKIGYSNVLPEEVECYFQLKRMLPIPYKRNHNTIIQADFNTNKYWFEFEPIPPSELENKETQLEALKSKLQSSLDLFVQFLEGEITATEYAITKLERKNVRIQIRKLEDEIKKLKEAEVEQNG